MSVPPNAVVVETPHVKNRKPQTENTLGTVAATLGYFFILFL